MNTTTLYHTIADDIPAVSITDKCIVIDLDQTFIATQENISQLKELGILSDPKLMSLKSQIYHITLEDLEKPGIGTKYEFWGIVRPHLYEFIVFCFSYFRIVAVWSAAKRPYVEAIVDHIFRDIRPPHIIFSADDCTIGPGGHLEKPLSKMIESNPVLRRHMSLQNTYALDDNPMTFVHNKDNAIHIPAYNPPLNVNAFAQDESALLQFKYWLLQPEAVNSRDVRVLEKNTIFSTPLNVYLQRLQSLPGYKFMSQN